MNNLKPLCYPRNLLLLWFIHYVFKDNGKKSNSNFVSMNNNNTCRYFGFLFQNMNLMTFGHITTSLFFLAIVDVNAKSILINNSTVKIIISENNSSNGIQASILMDRLYKDMNIPLQIEKKIQVITDKVSKLENKVESKSSFSTKTKSKGM